MFMGSHSIWIVATTLWIVGMGADIIKAMQVRHVRVLARYFGDDVINALRVVRDLFVA